MMWAGSNNNIATVEDGLVTFKSNGECYITANIENNVSASAICLVTVTDTPETNIEILLSPDINYVLEGMSRTYEVYLYEGEVQQSGSFVFSLNPNNVPITNYTFTEIDGNTFSIKNTLRDLESYLTISCTTGSVVPPKTFDIYLRGAWLYGSDT